MTSQVTVTGYPLTTPQDIFDRFTSIVKPGSGWRGTIAAGTNIAGDLVWQVEWNHDDGTQVKASLGDVLVYVGEAMSAMSADEFGQKYPA